MRLRFQTREDADKAKSTILSLAKKQCFLTVSSVKELFEIDKNPWSEDDMGWSYESLLHIRVIGRNLCKGRDIYYTITLPNPVSKRIVHDQQLKSELAIRLTGKEAAKKIYNSLLALAEDNKETALSAFYGGNYDFASKHKIASDTLLNAAAALKTAIDEGEYGA